MGRWVDGWSSYPSTESPYTSEEPTALMISSVRWVSRSQCASRSRTGMCSEHMGHWRVSARLTAAGWSERWERVVKRKRRERTVLYSERRWVGDTGIVQCIRNEYFRLFKCPLLPFTPEVRRTKTSGSALHREGFRYRLCSDSHFQFIRPACERDPADTASNK